MKVSLQAREHAFFLKVCEMPAPSSLPPPPTTPVLSASAPPHPTPASHPHCLPHPLLPPPRPCPHCLLHPHCLPQRRSSIPSPQKHEQQPAHCKCPKIQSSGLQIPLRSQRRHSTQSLCGGSLLPSLLKTSKHKHHCFAFLFQSSFMLLKYERKQQLLKLKYSRRKTKISQNPTHKNPVNIYVSIFRNYT